ncbi:DUF881 domain-containing protein [Intrasporangium calvum]|uniref:DUF881 domain-containing protein n=1 Tax=Intrasporangium calvum TaxID=53358 RepID=A0ABT5GC24_9MICO|nr:DUF881 domain-containing protein [Intrasporangium calvum]MDC5695664.1 DUF881 domain-containing protein [Intrasporangium calvum]
MARRKKGNPPAAGTAAAATTVPAVEEVATPTTEAGELQALRDPESAGQSEVADVLDPDPSTPEPSASEPTSTEPTSTEPTSTEPTSTEPTSTEPTSTEPTSTEPTSETDSEDDAAGGTAAGDAPVEDHHAPETEDGGGAPEPDADPDAPGSVSVPQDEPVEPTTASAGPQRVPPGHVEGRAAWRRLLLMSKPRTTKANVLGAILAIALGVAIATQVQLTNNRGLAELSQSDLIRLLDDISSRSSRLDQQIHELETTRDRLLSGTGNAGEALEQAQRRADTLGILAGTIGAQGPGITVSITDPDRGVSGPVILDLIQELRDAGAESIEVGGVRVVASSYVGDSGGDLSVDGQPLRRPILVKAIGDPNTLASAMTIPGGIVETIRLKGANASVSEVKSVTITSIHTPVEPVHAEPVQ